MRNEYISGILLDSVDIDKDQILEFHTCLLGGRILYIKAIGSLAVCQNYMELIM